MCVCADCRAAPSGPGAGTLQVAGGGSEGADMDFDSYQHYFYDYDCGEDFYRSTAPSEDIWKKFELVPSPPTSPPWGSSPGAGDLAPAIGPPEPWPGGGAGDEAESRGHSKAWGRNYASIIRRDCMWSGFSARERLERAVSDRLAAGAPRGNPPKAPTAPDCTPSLEAGTPATAAPCALGEPKTQACSGSESPSDSEGEEIDVVTVEKRQSLAIRKPVTITVRADPLDPCMKHFHIAIHQQQHNYAARFPPESCPQEGAPERDSQEEALGDGNAPEEKEGEEDEETVSPLPTESEAPRSYHPKPVSSDTEDVTKRKNHNFLERKRRNDLRSRFLALRDQVPTLASCSKAPKVVILSKALEYLQALVGAEKRMATEKRQLRCRQQQLQKRIAYLSGY
ncbi:protein L-Myc [Otolemur garnettii]|uniref:MYCL proto-onco, bHLH transcription factor n=1 Tax=Otolemur garnettii TaxID=30611 RepID=H0XD52_OTOGA|nr:protein L-Myc [Otolemur garnettii]